jgi:hypothetical protein
MHSHLAALRRIGQVLLIYCPLHLFALVGDILAQQPHSFAIDVLTGGLGFVLACGSLRAARVTAVAHALTLLAAGGASVALVIAMPRYLGPLTLKPDCAHEWLQLVWSGGWWLADLGLWLWIGCALLQRPASLVQEPGRRRPEPSGL